MKSKIPYWASSTYLYPNTDPEELLIKEESLFEIVDLISLLASHRQQQYIEVYIGLYHLHDATLKEMGELMGVTSSAVRQTSSLALDKVKKNIGLLNKYVCTYYLPHKYLKDFCYIQSDNLIDAKKLASNLVPPRATSLVFAPDKS